MVHLITLGQIPAGEPWLEVDCKLCLRHGRLSIPRLLAEHGPDYPVAHVVRGLTEDCPARKAIAIYERCKANCPQLAGWF